MNSAEVAAGTYVPAATLITAELAVEFGVAVTAGEEPLPDEPHAARNVNNNHQL
jgi:hypothetical protein